MRAASAPSGFPHSRVPPGSCCKSIRDCGKLQRLAGRVLLTCALASCGAASQGTPPTMPEPPSRDLKASFPDCPEGQDAVNLQVLKRCKGDLEAYRIGVLEPYNASVAVYSQRLTELDARLRTDAGAGRSSWESYEVWKEKIQAALDSAKIGGQLMAPYQEWFERYRQRIRFVIGEINLCETDPRRPC